MLLFNKMKGNETIDREKNISQQQIYNLQKELLRKSELVTKLEQKVFDMNAQIQYLGGEIFDKILTLRKPYFLSLLIL